MSPVVNRSYLSQSVKKRERDGVRGERGTAFVLQEVDDPEDGVVHTAQAVEDEDGEPPLVAPGQEDVAVPGGYLDLFLPAHRLIPNGVIGKHVVDVYELVVETPGAVVARRPFVLVHAKNRLDAEDNAQLCPRRHVSSYEAYLRVEEGAVALFAALIRFEAELSLVVLVRILVFERPHDRLGAGRGRLDRLFAVVHFRALCLSCFSVFSECLQCHQIFSHPGTVLCVTFSRPVLILCLQRLVPLIVIA